jgi:mannose-1-phosphate guanylyltransferase/mannose-6-phosphate isomerase
MGWCDIGNWDAVWNDLDHDAQGNALSGATVVLDSRNCLVRADNGILAAVVGRDEVVVIATEDAVLVASRHKTEQLTMLVETLKAQNRREAVEHRRIHRPWGFCQRIDSGPRHRVRRIAIHAGATLALPQHFRTAHWVVVKGTAEVTRGNDIRIVHENESIDFPIEGARRLANPGKILLELIEVQVGGDLGDDGICAET